MGIFDILRISSSGLKAQRTRMEVIAGNLANIHTTKTDEGGPYKKKEVVFMSSDVSDEKSFGGVLRKRLKVLK